MARGYVQLQQLGFLAAARLPPLVQAVVGRHPVDEGKRHVRIGQFSRRGDSLAEDLLGRVAGRLLIAQESQAPPVDGRSPRAVHLRDAVAVHTTSRTARHPAGAGRDRNMEQASMDASSQPLLLAPMDTGPPARGTEILSLVRPRARASAWKTAGQSPGSPR